MRPFLTAALLLLAGGLFAQAPKTPPGTPGEIKQELINIEREIGLANLNCDYRYFERIEAKEFIFTDAAGHVSNKSEDLAGEKDCHKSDGTYDVDDTEVRLLGAAAVVTGRVTTTRKSPEGTVVTRRSRFTDVFAWQDGRWQLAAGHSSRIPPPEPAKK